MSIIDCKKCKSPDCRGCNMYVLQTALHSGVFSTVMNKNRLIVIDELQARLNAAFDYIDTDGLIRVGDFMTWLGKFCRHIDMEDRPYTDDEAIAFFKKKLNQQFGMGGDNDSSRD